MNSPASANKSTLIGTDRDDLLEMGINCVLEYLHVVAEQADRGVRGAFADIAFVFPDQDRYTGSQQWGSGTLVDDLAE